MRDLHAALLDQSPPRVRWALYLLAALLVVFLAWAALYSAGVARRRIRLSTEQPISALWETIGACGNPPRDSSYDFAVIAIVLLVLVAGVLAFTTDQPLVLGALAAGVSTLKLSVEAPPAIGGFQIE
jgi:peptidoglycan/LPS O-acetylase OafA/YrhL